MNKYAQFKRHDAALYSAFMNIEREQMQASRLHKPGYRRKMRRVKNRSGSANKEQIHEFI